MRSLPVVPNPVALHTRDRASDKRVTPGMELDLAAPIFAVQDDHLLKDSVVVNARDLNESVERGVEEVVNLPIELAVTDLLKVLGQDLGGVGPTGGV
jgi:hypothetical protein